MTFKTGQCYDGGNGIIIEIVAADALRVTYRYVTTYGRTRPLAKFKCNFRKLLASAIPFGETEAS